MNDALRTTPRRMIWFLPVAAAAVLLGVTITVGFWIVRATSPAMSAVPKTELGAPVKFLAMMHIPEFALSNQDGDQINASIFDGRYTILAFTFTNCPTVCPIMHGHLLRLQGEMGVRIVTISVDPAHDTPEALRVYMDRLQIDSARWTMLTGAQETISAIAGGLKLGYTFDAADQIDLKDGGGTMANIMHSSKLVLIGPDRSALDLASGLEWEDVQRIGAHAQRLEASSGR